MRTIERIGEWLSKLYWFAISFWIAVVASIVITMIGLSGCAVLRPGEPVARVTIAIEIPLLNGIAAVGT